MKRKLLKSFLSLALVASILSLNTIVANAAVPNNVALYYTKGAPSSDVCTSNSFTFISCGNPAAIVNLSTFTTSGPYIRIATSPYTLKTQYYYGVTNGYIDVPYTNGKPSEGTKISTNVNLNNYSGYNSVYIYGIVTDANG